MTERIIPIQVEGRGSTSSQQEREESPESDKELSKSLEGLKVEPARSPSPDTKSQKNIQTKDSTRLSDVSGSRVKVKRAPAPSKNENEYLKAFDVLERREGNAILSEYTLPSSDVLERIILVIDRAQDENYTPFVVGSQSFSPLHMLKRAINIFIQLKLGINPYHEFAIIVMNENNSALIMEFTSDLRKLTDCVNRIEECETEDIFDLNSVFNILDDLKLPEPYAPGLPPPYTLRTIIFYGRSYTVPEVHMTEKMKAYFNNPFSVCDVLMTHEPVEISNNCQRIFDLLQNLDKKGLAYFFPVCRDLRRMHKCTAKLLGHPLQRPIQKLIKN